MPQLNIISYFSQTFWLFIFFGGFYLLVFYYFVIPVLVVLKTRSYLLSKLFEVENFFFLKSNSVFLTTTLTANVLNSLLFFNARNISRESLFFSNLEFFQVLCFFNNDGFNYFFFSKKNFDNYFLVSFLF